MIDFKGKVVLVTGGGAGIGRATTVLFGGLGAKIAVLEIDADRCEAVRSLLSGAGVDHRLHPQPRPGTGPGRHPGQRHRTRNDRDGTGSDQPLDSGEIPGSGAALHPAGPLRRTARRGRQRRVPGVGAGGLDHIFFGPDPAEVALLRYTRRDVTRAIGEIVEKYA